VKVHYYRALIYLYKFAGRFADQVAVNSSWTRAHMDEMWEKPKDQIETM
jgi:hypothetical protein